MHYVIHVIPVKPGSLDKAKEIFDKEVPPLAAGFDAWRGARLTATDDDQLVTMGIWADKDQMMQFLAQPAFAEAMVRSMARRRRRRRVIAAAVLAAAAVVAAVTTALWRRSEDW